MNTGVQRVARRLYEALRQHGPVTPMLWIPSLSAYCRPAQAEQDYLERPFHGQDKPTPSPERTLAPVFWAEMLRHLRHRHNRFHWQAEAGANDILLVPDIFQDNRRDILSQSPRWFPGQMAAMFYDASPLRNPQGSKSREQQTFPEYVRALAAFDKVLCPSHETEVDLKFYWRKFGLPAAPILVDPLPTEFGSRPTVKPPPHRKHPRVLYVASLHPRKNHLTLLAAAELLWKEGLQFELLLIGRTTTHGGPAVSAKLKQLHQRHRPVRWLGHVNDTSLHKAYQESYFSIYPSIHEGFGLPILESLWHGRPCICGENGAIGEVSLGGGCLTVDQHDPVSLAAGMRRLLTEPATYNRLSIEAINRQFRSWNDYAGTLLRTLQTAPQQTANARAQSGNASTGFAANQVR